MPIINITVVMIPASTPYNPPLIKFLVSFAVKFKIDAFVSPPLTLTYIMKKKKLKKVAFGLSC